MFTFRGGGVGVPVGTVISYFGNTAPEGYLKCDGGLYSSSAYPALSAHLIALNSSKYSAGGGQFRTPNLQGEFLRGSGTNENSGQGNGGTVGQHKNATEIPIPLYQQRNNKENARIGFRMSSDAADNEYNFPQNPDAQVNGSDGAVYFWFADSTSKGRLDSDDKRYAIKVAPTNTSVLFCIKY